ncbi:MAG: virulence factor [Candidatus Peregrinibacteria bacterium Greene0416_19]|nr:MAG: virulence factor [Candidatus Peregrinibacteria bacterium Greene0416_19]
MTLAITQFGASLVGLARDSLLARTFPDLGVVDVYIAAFRPSDLLFQVGIMSAMGTILVPILASHTARGREEEMHRTLSSTIITGSILFGCMALLLSSIFHLVAPAFVRFSGPSLDLYIRFGRLALITNFLFVTGNAAGQYLIAHQRYWIYGITPILYTLGTIGGTILLTPRFGPMGPMMGTLAGAILYVALRLCGIVAHGFRFRLTLWHPDLQEMGILMLPRMLALGALQTQLLFFDRIASGLDAGSVTINTYARNFQSVIVGVAGIAVAQSAYSLLSQAAAGGEDQRFRIYLRKGIGLLLGVTIAGAVLLVLLAPVAARLVHLSRVLNVFSIALLFYAISIPLESINHLLLRAYYATKNTFIPAVFSVLAGITAVTTAWILVDRFGLYGLGISYTLAQAVLILGLALFLRRRIDHIARS